MITDTCPHPSGTLLYPATDGEGNELLVFGCDECGKKYTEGA